MAIKKNEPSIDEKTTTLVTEKKPTSDKIKAKIKIANDELVTIINATQGELILVDSDGYPNTLEKFGDSAEFEYGELIKLKKRHPKVFSENLIQIPPNVATALGVEKFYQNFINVETFDEVFKLSEKELKDKVSSLSDSMKLSVGIRAINLIESGELDSIKKIKLLEDILGYELIER